MGPEAVGEQVDPDLINAGMTCALRRSPADRRRTETYGSAMTFAGVEYWDRYFQQLRESHDDLDWEGRWIEPFQASLRRAQVRTVLELGRGTGNDAMRLVDEGYAVTALDISREAIEQVRSRYGSSVSLYVADMTLPLPFPDSSFDAVSPMSRCTCFRRPLPARCSRRSDRWYAPRDCSCSM
jgi:SAM-dependent methyltransferase